MTQPAVTCTHPKPVFVCERWGCVCVRCVVREEERGGRGE